MSENTLKHRLLAACAAYVQDRVDRGKEAMESAQESANTETKSSAGDKHETGRAMAQLEREKSARQLAEAMKLKHALASVDADKVHDSVELGSLVITSNGKFYISISAGKIEVDGEMYFAISAGSPIGQQLIGKRAGDEASFNKRSFQITELL